MPASKIQDEQEVLRWFADGKTYEEMSRIYLEKYNIETVPSMWGNFRRRHGLTRRIVRDDTLIPWRVKPEHKHAFYVQLLRWEARERAGAPLRDRDRHDLTTFRERLRREKLVVDYDEAEGFRLVSRLPSDRDIIRRPRVRTVR